MINQWTSGTTALMRGIRLFYTHKKWWKHALIPMLGALLIYIGLGLLVYFGLQPQVRELFDGVRLSGALAMLVGFARWVAYVAIWVLFSVVVLFTVSLVYELFGCVFLDELVAKCEKDIYKLPPLTRPIRVQIGQAYQAFLYGVNTAGWHLLLLCLVIFLPVFGWGLAILVLGYRLGVSYFFSVSFYHNMTTRQARELARANGKTMLGFGASAYLLLLIPLGAIFLLPCLVIGGTVIYHEVMPKSGLKG